MSRSKKYIITGVPIPWARAGVNNGRFFDKQKLHKLNCANQFEIQHNSEPMFEGPLRAEFFFYLPIPQSKSKKVQTQLIDTWHFFKPDNSNLLKFYEDAGTGILYQDDCQICDESLKKKYDDGNGPRVEITIWEIK